VGVHEFLPQAFPENPIRARPIVEDMEVPDRCRIRRIQSPGGIRLVPGDLVPEPIDGVVPSLVKFRRHFAPPLHPA
jgi:hypothetical protein